MNRKFTKTSFFFVVTIILFSASCSKNTDTPADNNPVPAPAKLAKLEYGNGDYDSLFYNTNGNVIRIKTHTVVPNPYDDIFILTYNENNKVSRITDRNGEYYDYRYVNNQLISVQHFVAGQKEDYKLYDYENGKLTQIEEYYKEFPGALGHLYTSNRRFIYFADGNLKQEVHYYFDAQRNLKKNVTIDYTEYDTKQSPLEPMGRFLYLSQVPLAKNNIRKYTTKDEITGTQAEFNFEYTYNSLSSPLTHKVTYTENGISKTDTVKYYYY